MSTKDRPSGNLEEGSSISQEKLRDMRKQMLDMQMEIAILRETLKVLKKDPGVNWGDPQKLDLNGELRFAVFAKQTSALL